MLQDMAHHLPLYTRSSSLLSETKPSLHDSEAAMHETGAAMDSQDGSHHFCHRPQQHMGGSAFFAEAALCQLYFGAVRVDGEASQIHVVLVKNH